MSRTLATAIAIFATGMIASVANPVFASANLVTNGNFEINGDVGQIASGISYLSDWTNTALPSGAPGFNFVVDDTADSTGFASVNTPTAHTNIFVWGPGRGVDNGFQTSTNGGYFLGSDASYNTSAVTQSISNLVAGHTYAIKFEWAQAQFTDNSAATTSGWNVSLGNQTVSTGTPILAGKDFSGWNDFASIFTATAATETLSFLATGSPAGGPPFALVDGVSLTDTALGIPPPNTNTPTISAVPESSTYVMLLCGLGFLGMMISRQRRKNQQ